MLKVVCDASTIYQTQACHAKTPLPSMNTKTQMRVPVHVGFIPDGNRRWAATHGLPKEDGYTFGIAPGISLLRLCMELGIPEMYIFGFTQDNTQRATIQKEAFSNACIKFAMAALQEGAALKVVGDDSSRQFPDELRPYLERQKGKIRVNLLVNYDWRWDLEGLKQGVLRTHEIPMLDLIVRWGGGRRLSGFLPVQSVYTNMYVVEEYWPNFKDEHFDSALLWFAQQDRTMGG